MVLPLVVAMVFTLFLIPLAAVVLVLSMLTIAYGGVALSLMLSRALARRTGSNRAEPRAAAVGAVLLAAALHLLVQVPMLGTAAMALTAVVAAGSVVLTGFGLRPYTPDDTPDGPAGTS